MKEFPVGADTTGIWDILFLSLTELSLWEGFSELEIAGFRVEFVSVSSEICSVGWSEE